MTRWSSLKVADPSSGLARHSGGRLWTHRVSPQMPCWMSLLTLCEALLSILRPLRSRKDNLPLGVGHSLAPPLSPRFDF